VRDNTNVTDFVPNPGSIKTAVVRFFI